MATTKADDALSAVVWPVRLLRVLAASTIAVALALGSHKVGGGHIASGSFIGVLFALVTAITWFLSSRRLTPTQIVGLLLLTQIAVHLSCVFGAQMVSWGTGMVAGHLLGTALTATILARGEQFLWALAERLGLRVIPLLNHDRLLPSPHGIGELPAYEERRPPAFVFAGGLGLRGPPVGT